MIESTQLLTRLTKRFTSLAARPEMWGTVDMLEATYLSYLDVALMICGATVHSLGNPNDKPVELQFPDNFITKEYAFHRRRMPKETTHLEMVDRLLSFHERLATFAPTLKSTIPTLPEIPDGTAPDQPPTV